MAVQIAPVPCINCGQATVGVLIDAQEVKMSVQCGCVYSDDDKAKMMAGIRKGIAKQFGLEMPEEEDEEGSDLILPGG